MKHPDIQQKQALLALSKWDRDPELRAEYKGDLQAYAKDALLQILRELWNHDSELRAEFGDNFEMFRSFAIAEKRGVVKIAGQQREPIL